MIIQAVLGNPNHPEYGVATIPFPIPEGQYGRTLELLQGLDLGDAVRQDCRIMELGGTFPILKRLEGGMANMDELDYLAKRLDSFDAGERAQFQGAAAAGVSGAYCEIKDFINLTFCCQEATVVADFSDLAKIGQAHYMTLRGGCMSMEEAKTVDFRMEALKLLENETGQITPYGVVYGNGMELAQFYDGRHFPDYRYDHCVAEVGVVSDASPKEAESTGWLYLPMTEEQIDRALCRAGIEGWESARLELLETELPEEVDILLELEAGDLRGLNSLCEALKPLSEQEMAKLNAAVLFAKPSKPGELEHLAKQLDLFDFVPDARTPEDYGRYMIRESGHFEYDENLEGFYDFGKYGKERMEQEMGAFVAGGYVSYRGMVSMEELLAGVPCERMDMGMGGME